MAVEAALRPWMPAIPLPTRIERVAAAIAAQATKGSAPVVSAARPQGFMRGLLRSR